MFSQLLTGAVSVALIGAGTVVPSSIRSSDAMALSVAADGDGVSDAGTCRVDVVRTGESGTVSSTRTVLKDRSCVCTLVTGSAGNNGNAEDVVTAMLRDRTCPNSPMVGQTVSEVARTGGGGGLIIPVLVGVVGAAGLAVALGSHSRG